MTDLPAEIGRIAANPTVAETIANVFDGAKLVSYHPEKALIAVWYGGTGFNVYDPEQWSTSSYNGSEMGEVHHFNMPDQSQLDNPHRYARDTLEDYGFEVVGE